MNFKVFFSFLVYNISAINVGGPLKAASTQILVLSNGSTLSATSDAENITYNASVLKGTYMAIGYGSAMYNTDMVIWAAADTTSDSVQYDAKGADTGNAH